MTCVTAAADLARKIVFDAGAGKFSNEPTLVVFESVTRMNAAVPGNVTPLSKLLSSWMAARVPPGAAVVPPTVARIALAAPDTVPPSTPTVKCAPLIVPAVAPPTPLTAA